MNALLALPDLQPERLFVQSGDVRLAVHCWARRTTTSRRC